MEQSEYHQLHREWMAAEDIYHDYIKQFITTSINGTITNQATKMVTMETAKRSQTLRKNADEKKNEFYSYLKDFLNKPSV